MIYQNGLPISKWTMAFYIQKLPYLKSPKMDYRFENRLLAFYIQKLPYLKSLKMDYQFQNRLLAFYIQKLSYL